MDICCICLKYFLLSISKKFLKLIHFLRGLHQIKQSPIYFVVQISVLRLIIRCYYRIPCNFLSELIGPKVNTIALIELRNLLDVLLVTLFAVFIFCFHFLVI